MKDKAPIRLVAMGDLALGDSSTCVGFGFGSRFRNRDLSEALAFVRPAWASADVVFANLETTLAPPSAGTASRWRSLQMRGEPRFAAELGAAGFRVLHVANNHAVQHGRESFERTVALLRASGIHPCGVRGTAPWASEPAIVATPKGDVGFLGYCLRPRQFGREEPPYAEGTSSQILADVARLRARMASVVVSLHWGEEFVERPSRAEVDLGHAIIEAGGAMVLGHHPHVVRPVERYRHGVIAYSLGNLVGDMLWYRPFRTGLIVDAEISDGAAGEAALLTTELGGDLVPRSVAPSPALEEGTLGLDDSDYQTAIRHTIAKQRWAAYVYALRNLWRFPPGVLAELAATTVRNKMTRLLHGTAEGEPS